MTLQEMARMLAEKQATDVVLALPAQVLDTVVWRDTTDRDVHWEVKYLRMRGLLRHNPEKPHLVVLRSVS